MSPAEIYLVAVMHLMAWPAVRYWMVYRKVAWKNGPTGKALFNKARSLALMLAILVVGFWYPFPGFIYVKAAAFTYLAAAIWYQYRVMLALVKHRQQREDILARFTLHPEGDPDGRQAPAPVRQDHP